MKLKRSTGVGIAIGAVCIGVACGTYAYVNAHSRYRFVGKTDPVTGYHIEFTVSNGFVRGALPQYVQQQGSVQEIQFEQKPSPRAIQWFYTRVLRRPAAPKHLPGDMSGINCITGRIADLKQESMKIDSQGYIDLFAPTQPFSNMLKITNYRRRIVSGNLETFCDVEFPASNFGTSARITCAVTHPNGAPVYAAFAGFMHSDSGGPDITQEVNAIVRSVQLVRRK